MKGYDTSNGYMGYVEGKYILFASEQEYFEFMGEGTMVPDELIPRCPHCGAEMFPWVRGYGNFLQGKKYE